MDVRHCSESVHFDFSSFVRFRSERFSILLTSSSLSFLSPGRSVQQFVVFLLYHFTGAHSQSSDQATCARACGSSLSRAKHLMCVNRPQVFPQNTLIRLAIVCLHTHTRRVGVDMQYIHNPHQRMGSCIVPHILYTRPTLGPFTLINCNCMHISAHGGPSLRFQNNNNNNVLVVTCDL